MTDLPFSTKLGVKVLLVITDWLNTGVILIPILLIFTSAVATAFIEHYIPYHGFSKAIINNKGTKFINTMWAIICEALGIERRLFLAYHPETDGATKRANQVI